MNKKAWKSFVIYLVIFLLFLSLLEYFTSGQTQQTEQIIYNQNYSELMKGAEKGDVKSITITSYDNYQEVEGTTKNK